MPSYRKLPSGRWQATVRLPNGKRTSRTFDRRTQAHQWAQWTKTQIDRGEWVDLRSAAVAEQVESAIHRILTEGG